MVSSIAEILKKKFGYLGVESRILEYKIFKHWGQCVGYRISGSTEPYRFIRNRLFVKVSSHAWMSELTLLKPEMTEKMNRSLAADDIKIEEIVFKTGKVQHKGRNSLKGERAAPKKIADVGVNCKKAILSINDEEMRSVIVMAMNKSLSQQEESDK